MADDDLTDEEMTPLEISDAEMAAPEADVPVPSTAYALRVQQGQSLSNFFGRISKYAQDGWGDDPVGLDPDGEVEKWLVSKGLLNDPKYGAVSPLRAFNDAIVRPTVNMLDLARKTIMAGVGATGATVGQVADALLGTVTETAGPEKAAKDFAGMIEVMPQLAPFNTVGPLTRAARSKGLTGTTDEMLGTGFATPRQTAEAKQYIQQGENIADATTPQLERLYQEKGIHPAEAATDAAKDPTIRQSLLSKGGDLPDEYTGASPETNGVPPTPPKPPSKPPVPEPQAGGGGDLVPPGGKPPGPPGGKPPGPGDGGLSGGKPDPIDDTASKYFEDRLSVGEAPPGEALNFSRFYENAVDRLVPLDRAFSDAGLATFADPNRLARLYAGWGAKADYMLRKATFGFHDYKNSGKSYEDIIGKFSPSELKEFRVFVSAARAAELSKRGIEPFSDFNAKNAMTYAAEVVARGAKKYEQPFKELIEFQNRVTSYLRDAGMVSRRGYESMLIANKYYVPWHQVIDPAEMGWQVGSGGMTPQQTVFKIEVGKANKVIDPLETIVRNTMAAVSMAERNQVAQAVVRGLKDIEVSGELKRVPGTALAKMTPEERAVTVLNAERRVTRPKEVGPKDEPTELSTWLDEAGVRIESGERVTSDGGAQFDWRTSFQQELRQLFARNEGPGEIVYFENGKRMVAEVGEDIARAIKGLNTESVGPFVKAMGVLASGLRKGALWNPAFWARHTLRDIYASAITYRGVGTLTYADTLRGLHHGFLGRLGKSEHFDNFIKGGGGNSSMAALTRRYEQDTLAELTRQTGLVTRVQNIVADPSQGWLQKGGRLAGTPFKVLSKYTLHPLQVTTELVMEANKLGAYMRRMDELNKSPTGTVPGAHRALEPSIRDHLRALPDGRDMPAVMEAGDDLPARIRQHMMIRPGTTFKQARQAVIDAEFTDVHLKATPEKQAIMDAAFVGRDTSLDTARIGAKMRAWNIMTAFLNTRIQEPDYLVRMAKKFPERAAMVIGVGITLPSVLLWLANHDDPRYQNLPAFQKDNHWIIMTDDWQPTELEPDEDANTSEYRLINGQWHRNMGTIYRIPKPFSLGVAFGSGAERLLEAFANDNPEAFKGFKASLLNSLVGDLHMTGTVPVIEQAMNRRMFTGQNLIPAPMEKLLPEYQYTPYTTELAKAVAGIMSDLPGLRDTALDSKDFSTSAVARTITNPILIENYIRGWTGGLGMDVLQALDYGLRKAGVLVDPVNPPLKTLADVPYVRSFVIRWPSATVQSMQDFYDMAARDDKYFQSWMDRAKAGDTEAMERLEAAGGNSILLRVDSIKSVISQGHTAIRMYMADPDMQPAEKRQLIDETYHGMVAASVLGKKILTDARKKLTE